jgi:hypothetical protein
MLGVNGLSFQLFVPRQNFRTHPRDALDTTRAKWRTTAQQQI